MGTTYGLGLLVLISNNFHPSSILVGTDFGSLGLLLLVTFTLFQYLQLYQENPKLTTLHICGVSTINYDQTF